MKTFFITYFKVIEISKTATGEGLHRHVLLSMSGECWSVLRQRTKEDRWTLGEVVTVELLPAETSDTNSELEPFTDELPDLDVEIEAVEPIAPDSGLRIAWEGEDAILPMRVEVPDRYDAVVKAWNVEVAKRFVQRDTSPPTQKK